MKYLSDATLERLMAIGEIAEELDIDLGPAMSKRSNGDCAWFVLLRDKSLYSDSSGSRGQAKPATGSRRDSSKKPPIAKESAAAKNSAHGDEDSFASSDMYVLVITPHIVLSEFSLAGSKEFAIVSDIFKLFETLKRHKYRCMNAEEFAEFTRSSAGTPTTQDGTINLDGDDFEFGDDDDPFDDGLA